MGSLYQILFSLICLIFLSASTCPGLDSTQDSKQRDGLHDADKANQASWKKSTHIDIQKAFFSSQELIHYMNASFPHKRFKKGDRLYRCAQPDAPTTLNYPAFFAVSEIFLGYQIPPFSSSTGLCADKRLYAYTVKQDFYLIDLLTNLRYYYPNNKPIKQFDSVRDFHHPIHAHKSNWKQVGPHFLDALIAQAIKENPVKTKKILSQKNPRAIGRVVYFCDKVLDDEISKAYNKKRRLAGWLDYDPGYAPPKYNQIQSLSEMQIAQKAEVLLCHPDAFLEPNPLVIEESLP